MTHSSIPSAQTVVLHCKAKGVKNIVISPGSRNAPLTFGFTEDSFFSCFSIVDERCAAFFALGIAQQLKEPVALVCTSGSALLNYYPAIAEAFFSDIPLVVISADRPTYKIDIGDGQTIRQDNVFERHIGYSANLRQDVVHAEESIRRFGSALLTEDTIQASQEKVQAFNDDELNEALNIALKMQIPVHINVPFEESLYDYVENLTVEPVYVFPKTVKEEPISEMEDFTTIWNDSKRKMILVGVNPPNSVEKQFLNQLGKDPSVIVLTETTSNIHHNNFFPSIDGIIAPIEKSDRKDELFKALQPDLLLTFGGLIVSKKIKSVLRNYKPQHHWHVNEKKAYDTFFSLTYHIKTDINNFFARFLPTTNYLESNYFKYWNGIKVKLESKREEYIGQIRFSDMLAFYHVANGLPDGCQLQLANSSTVRYMQLFAQKPSVSVFCNRGTSGIDGSTSTAVGAAVYSEPPTVLLTGDLSFFYDSNALWNRYIRNDFRIILINNGGGGIFRILPGNNERDNFERFFETTHGLDAQNLCKMYGFEYQAVSNSEVLKNSLADFFEESSAPRVLEVKTPRILNDKILLGYFDFISSEYINH